MVNISDKVLDAAKDWLIKHSKKWHNGVCLGQAVDLNGRYLAGEDYGACHAWVSSPYKSQCYGGKGWAWNTPYAKDAKNFLTMTCHSKVRSKQVCSPEACDFLVLWMAKESPFSQYILNRDDDKSLTEGGVVILCGPDGVSQAQCMWICKVLRFITEGEKAADTFMTLVKGGVDPMLAVLVASYIRTINGATFGFTGLNAHSTVFSEYYAKANPIALLTKTLNDKATSTADVFKAPANLKFPAGIMADPAKKIKGFCKPFKKSDGWGGFVQGTGADEVELVRRVLEWQADMAQHLPDYDATFPPVLQPDPPMPDSNTVYLELDL